MHLHSKHTICTLCLSGVTEENYGIATCTLVFPCGSAGKKPACIAGDLGSIPGLGISPGKGKGYPLQYSGLEKSMDCIAYGVAKSRTRLSDLHSFTHAYFVFISMIVLGKLPGMLFMRHRPQKSGLNT